jgi:phosphatidylethanolamine-binding protein (PEBP) family uncharacterized protein
MHVTSPAFSAGGTIPRKYSCDGADVPPPLGPFPHWILYDIADHHPRSSSGWAGVQNGFRLSIQIMLAVAVRDGGALTHG